MWRDDAHLLDIFLYARRALRFNASVTWEEFKRNELLQHGTVRALEVIGEAANKVSEEFRDAHPEIP